MEDVIHEPDAGFVQRLQAGEEQAFRELLARWQRPVLSFVYRMTADATAADDIAQDVFVRVFRRIGDFRLRPGHKAFSTWVFQIARNAALDYCRYRRRHPAQSMDALAEGGERLAGAIPPPDAAAATTEIGVAVARAVTALPEDQRTALVLAEYEGRSVADIAAVMECSQKSVESRLYRARQNLRRQLAHLLPD